MTSNPGAKGGWLSSGSANKVSDVAVKESYVSASDLAFWTFGVRAGIEVFFLG